MSKVQHIRVLLFTIYLLLTAISALIGKFTFNRAIITFLIFMIICYRYKHLRNKRLLIAGNKVIDKMSGEEFEEFLQLHFKKMGYKSHLTPLRADYGADLVLKKKGKKTVVQAKRWSQHVGVEAVQQAVASIKYYKADSAMVITNNFFTENARILAKVNDVKLIDRNSLQNIINHDEDNCPICKGKIKKVDGKYGKFYGCLNYPKCRYTKSI